MMGSVSQRRGTDKRTPEAPGAAAGQDDGADKTTTSEDDQERQKKGLDRRFRAALERRSKLEKEAGAAAAKQVTTHDILERFPELKNAPMEAGETADNALTFRPVGKSIRNVRCLRCGQWGHQTGDRECAMRHTNPKGAQSVCVCAVWS